MEKNLLLIDADILVYKTIATLMSEVSLTIQTGEEYIHGFLCLTEAKRMILSTVESLEEEINAENSILCWSDWSKNWRKRILPSYKNNRKVIKKPMGLTALRNYVMSSDLFTSAMFYSLEGDDVMGILATNPDFKPDYRKIIVSEDKDMKTIPGYLYNPSHKEEGICCVPEDEADQNHMIQALAGDRVDGYSGCPGVGVTRATAWLEQNQGAVKEGSNYKNRTFPTKWKAVVSHYKKAGLNEEDALVQAQVARILRHEDFDPYNGVKLWKPQE